MRILDQLAFRRFRTETSLDRLLQKAFPDRIVVAAAALEPNAPPPVYQCAKCSTPLFARAHLMPYPAFGPPCAAGEPTARGNDPLKGGESAGGAHFCQAHLLEPMRWMMAAPARIDRNFESGTLPCPGCAELVGAFSWKPLLCECGLFLPFYFCVHPSKVKESASKAKS